MTRTHPIPDVEEALPVGQIEHQQKTHGVSEESCCEAAEPEKTVENFSGLLTTSDLTSISAILGISFKFKMFKNM